MRRDARLGLGRADRRPGSKASMGRTPAPPPATHIQSARHKNWTLAGRMRPVAISIPRGATIPSSLRSHSARHHSRPRTDTNNDRHCCCFASSPRWFLSALSPMASAGARRSTGTTFASLDHLKHPLYRFDSESYCRSDSAKRLVCAVS